ncbi:pentapeptide repeat-containing protein [Kitasatospora sp. NPDC091207]|uniref:pentapeptide repeat-containing protein n=1 Tax=Kitasatospora sp. NPDC091207 TaxID=3364083 RepID=UPI0037F99016
MDTRTFGRVRVTLPDLADGYLLNVTTLENSRGTVQDFQYADADLRDLDLAHARLITGRIGNLRAARVRLEDVRADSVEFDGCDLGSAQWADGKLSRVVFRNCKIMGANLSGLTLDNVIFENCRLDYSSFEQVRATGPVAFSRCVLSETTFTGCDLTRAILEDCTLRATEFGRGTYKDVDLRGNELSGVRGVANLARVIIDHAQQADLGQALAAELAVTWGEDLPVGRAGR